MFVVDQTDERLVHSLDDIARGLHRSRVVLWIIAFELLAVLLAIAVLIAVEMFR